MVLSLASFPNEGDLHSAAVQPVNPPKILLFLHPSSAVLSH